MARMNTQVRTACGRRSGACRSLPPARAASRVQAAAAAPPAGSRSARPTPATTRPPRRSTGRPSRRIPTRSTRWSGSDAATPAWASTPAPSRRSTRRTAASRRTRDVLLELARTQLGAGQPQAALANLDIARWPSARATCAHHRARHRARPAQPPRRGAGDLPRGAEARPDRLRAPQQPRPVARALRPDRRRHRHPARTGARRHRPTPTPAATSRWSTASPGREREATATLRGDLSRERDPEQPRLLPRAARPAC